MTPEEQARQNIDKQLQIAGWQIQEFKNFNPGATLGIAVTEYSTDTGPADYILVIDREPVGVIEAKPEGTPLTKVEEQAERYARSKLKWREKEEILRFIFESTGVETRFTDNNDPLPRSREIFTFPSPEALQKLIKGGQTLRARLHNFPPLLTEGFYECQVRAINNLEISFSRNRTRALIQMATGSGKTFTAITSVYRLLKFAKAKRVLFLVDTRNLGEQAEQEFQAYTPNDDKRKFTELYNVQRLTSKFIDPDSQVCISTIQRMYSILKGEELPEGAEDSSLNELQMFDKPVEVAYNKAIPPEFFDFLIVDECHRSIYNIWKQVLDYFDTFMIGLTATPDSRTYGFFNENVVSEYSHEEAVADGVNVGYDIYTIETKITRDGAVIEAQEFVDVRSKLTREKRWKQLDEEVTYEGKQLDKDIVNPSTIRNIIKTFRDKLKTEIFPGRDEVPKTLVFAKTDSHADDIIKIIREEFGESNQFCKKITYKVKDEKPSEVLQQFRTTFSPRIAVTVDMIATGTDVKPIECLLFMRDVRSKNYFEQMKGRGTRVLKGDDLKRVTPSAKTNKTHFVVVDAVGVCKSIKVDGSRSLERKRNIPLKDLMQAVIIGKRDEDTLLSIANRLTRIDKKIKPEEKEKFKELAESKSISSVVKDLINSYSPDKHIEKAKEKFSLEENEQPTVPQIKQAKDEIIFEACKVFDNPDLRNYIEEVRSSYEQIIDTVNIDIVVSVGFDEQAKEMAETTIKTFKQFLKDKKDEITALSIFYSQPYRRRELTFRMIKELNEEIQKPPYLLSTERVWQAYNKINQNNVKGATSRRILTDIISLIRFELEIDSELAPYSDIVNQNYKNWIFKRNAEGKIFTEEQTQWLRMIRDHIVTSAKIETQDFDNTPFAEKGGLAKIWDIFGDDMNKILEELNKVLAA